MNCFVKSLSVVSFTLLLSAAPAHAGNEPLWDDLDTWPCYIAEHAELKVFLQCQLDETDKLMQEARAGFELNGFLERRRGDDEMRFACLDGVENATPTKAASAKPACEIDALTRLFTDLADAARRTHDDLDRFERALTSGDRSFRASLATILAILSDQQTVMGMIIRAHPTMPSEYESFAAVTELILDQTGAMLEFGLRRYEAAQLQLALVRLLAQIRLDLDAERFLEAAFALREARRLSSAIAGQVAYLEPQQQHIRAALRIGGQFVVSRLR